MSPAMCCGHVGGRAQLLQPRTVEASQDGVHLRQQGQAVAQAGQVARPGASQGDASGDALDVGALPQDFVNARIGCSAASPEQGGNGVLAGAQGGVIAQRVMQPVAQQAAAHAAGAGVEQGEQGGRRFAAQGFADFQIAPRRGVEQHIVAFMLHAQALDMGQLAALRGLGILQQRAGRGDRGVQAGAAEAVEVAGGELPGQLLHGGVMVELPWRQRLGRAFRRVQRGMRPALGKQDFRRLDALQRRGKTLRRHFRHA